MQSRPAKPFEAPPIEPSPPDQRSMEHVLQESGLPHHLCVFSTEVSALTVLENDATARFDIVIVNVVLPMLDIREAIAKLRALPRLKEAKFAVTIGASHECDEVPEGCHVIMKPVDANQLRALLALGSA